MCVKTRLFEFVFQQWRIQHFSEGVSAPDSGALTYGLKGGSTSLGLPAKFRLYPVLSVSHVQSVCINKTQQKASNRLHYLVTLYILLNVYIWRKTVTRGVSPV